MNVSECLRRENDSGNSRGKFSVQNYRNHRHSVLSFNEFYVAFHEAYNYNYV